MEGRTAAAVRAVVEPTVRGLGFDLILVEVASGSGGRRTLRLYIDRLGAGGDGGGRERGGGPTGGPGGEGGQGAVLGEDAGGVDLDDCVSVSREVATLLDVEDPIDGAYVLEVSSPGLDRPLVRPSDFERHRGRRVRLRTREPIEGRRNFSGVLLDFRTGQGGEVVLETDGATQVVPFRALKRAHIDSRFDPAPGQNERE